MAGLDLVRVLHRKSTKGSLGWISLLLKSVLSDSLRISCVPLKCTLLTISLSCCVVKRILAMCFADSCSLPLTDSDEVPYCLTESRVREFYPVVAEVPSNSKILSLRTQIICSFTFPNLFWHLLGILRQGP